MKAISITLTQEPDGQSFRVKSFTNTAQLRVGQIVSADVMERWVNSPDLRHVTVSVIGATPEAKSDEEQQPSLFEKPKRKQFGQTVVMSK